MASHKRRSIRKISTIKHEGRNILLLIQMAINFSKFELIRRRGTKDYYKTNLYLHEVIQNIPILISMSPKNISKSKVKVFMSHLT